MSKSHRSGRPTIGVLAGWAVYNTNLHSFLGLVMEAIRTAAQQRNCNILFACGLQPLGPTAWARPAWPELSDQTDYVPVGSWNTDGLIVVTPLGTETQSNYIQRIIRERHPRVFIGMGENGYRVAPDNEGGLEQAVAHLVAHGHRRIAYIAGPTNLHGDNLERLQAYRKAVEQHGLETDPALIVHPAIDDPALAIQALMTSETSFTALVATNDDLATAAVRIAQESGRRVPEDLAVVGFDDRVEAAGATPPLTTVHYPAQQAGGQALDVLLQLLNGQTPPAETIRIPTWLVIRRSCGCMPGTYPSQATNQPHQSIEQAMSWAVLSSVSHVSETLLLAWQLRTEQTERRCQQLVALFKQHLTDGDTAHFTAEITNFFNEINDANAWQAALDVLADRLPELVGEQSNEHQREEAWKLLNLARSLISRATQYQLDRYLLLQGWTNDRLGLLTSQLLSGLGEDHIYATLAEHLPQVNLKRAEVALFESEADNPVAWSTLRAVTDPSGFRFRFRSQEFPPPGLYPDESSFQVALMPLIVPGEALGFMVFDAVRLDLCASIVRQVAAAFKSIRLYQRAVEGQQLAEEANRLKSRLLSTVSHELRTPLNLIIGLSEILTYPQTDGAEAKPYREELERIHLSARHLDGLIRDVLDLARSEAGQLRLAFQRINFAEILRSAADVGQQLARAQGLTWIDLIPDNLPEIWGDPTRLRQVLLNLINNAVKFTEKGTITLEVKRMKDEVGRMKKTEILPSAFRLHPSDFILFRISDTGLGIPPAEQAMIFNEFRQSERTTARGYGGLGLGLAICKRLIELHGGEIGVRSSGEEGKGTTFFFSLPIPTSSSAADRMPSLQSTQVLLLTQKLGSEPRLHEHLAAQGYKVREVVLSELVHLLPELLAQPPAAIVLGAAPASQQGWEILQMLKEHPGTRDIPVLLFALSEQRNVGSVLELDYLLKPVGKSDLARALTYYDLPTRPTPTILIVDDEPGILELHTRLVREQLPNCRILQARDGNEALNQLRQTTPDLVLLDLLMPGLDGFGVLETLRQWESTQDLPVIVLTAHVLSEEELNRLNRGVAAVLTKGIFSAAETVAYVEATLARQRRLGTEAQRLVRKAMTYLQMHYMEPVSREEVAQHIGVSEGHLSRCFHQELKLTIKEYLNRYRVNQAKKLLKAGQLSVAEVAAAVGFSSPSYFSQVFQKEVGMSPGVYASK